MRIIVVNAEWSGGGATLAKAVRRVALAHGLSFTAVNVDAEPEAVSLYSLQTLPEVILVEGGAVVGRLAGLVSECELRRKVGELLAAGRNADGTADGPPRAKP